MNPTVTILVQISLKYTSRRTVPDRTWERVHDEMNGRPLFPLLCLERSSVGDQTRTGGEWGGVRRIVTGPGRKQEPPVEESECAPELLVSERPTRDRDLPLPDVHLIHEA